MEQRKILSLATTTLLLIVVFAHLLSCSDVNERLRFTEFFLLPTAPYYRKSYIEHIPDEEVATRQVDFEAKIAAIQEIYTAFIKAYREEDMSALTKTLDISQGMEWGTLSGLSHGWFNIKSFLEAKWSKATSGLRGRSKLGMGTDRLLYSSRAYKDPLGRSKCNGPYVLSRSGFVRLYYTASVFLPDKQIKQVTQVADSSN